jgi:hypothetical protein
MTQNTLLKVLEQLLHKIKANRRREISGHPRESIDDARQWVGYKLNGLVVLDKIRPSAGSL